MKIAVVCLLCVSFAVIYEVESKVKSSNVPKPMTLCFGYYKKKTNLLRTAAGAIHAMCSNYFQWFEAAKLNAKHKASPDTIQYITGLFHKTRQQIHHHRVRRLKRQAAGLPLPTKKRPKRVRKEIRMMKEKDIQLFFEAINTAKRNTSIAPNKYEALAAFHTGITSVSAHGGCNFLGWHRMYILMFENALREEHPRFRKVTVPYMDSRLDNRMEDPTQSAMWSHRLMGTCQGEAKTGIFGDGWDSETGVITRACGADGPLMTDGAVANVTEQYRLRDICGEDSEIYNDLEFFHNGFHRFIGGQMASLQSSVYDPIFWLHHAFIDLIWEIFRQNQIRHGVDPEEDYPPNPTTIGAHELQLPDAKLGFGDLLVKQGLSNIFTDEWYTYDPPPSCTVKKPRCGSIYLKCVIDYPEGKPRARCVARTLQEVLEAEKPKPEPCPEIPPTKPPVTPSPTTWNPYPTTDPIPEPTVEPTPYPTPHPEPYPYPHPKPHPANIQAVQNTFCLNGKSDINQWVYLPVKIIFRRPPEYTNFGSYPVERGKIQRHRGDIYSPSAYSNVYRHLHTAKNPAKYEDCMEPDTPTTTIYVSSMGLNYEGTYKEVAICDQRLAVTVATAYIAVRKPLSAADQSVALLHAQDKCGRACKPICKVPGTDIFRPCSGAVSVTGGIPLQFGNSLGDAVLDVWDFNKDKDCPQMSTETMVVSFYCDFKADWMWPSMDPPVKAPPLGHQACSFGWGCIVRRPCHELMTCQNGEILPCEKSCSLFARCLNNNFYVHRCGRNEMYVHGTGCVRGSCDYRKSRQELKLLAETLKVEQKTRNRGLGRGMG